MPAGTTAASPAFPTPAGWTAGRIPAYLHWDLQFTREIPYQVHARAGRPGSPARNGRSACQVAQWQPSLVSDVQSASTQPPGRSAAAVCLPAIRKSVLTATRHEDRRYPPFSWRSPWLRSPKLGRTPMRSSGSLQEQVQQRPPEGTPQKSATRGMTSVDRASRLAGSSPKNRPTARVWEALATSLRLTASPQIAGGGRVCPPTAGGAHPSFLTPGCAGKRGSRRPTSSMPCSETSGAAPRLAPGAGVAICWPRVRQSGADNRRQLVVPNAEPSICHTDALEARR